MKILITGGCGFVGSNLALFLKKKGFKVHTLDNLTRKGSRYNFNLLKKTNNQVNNWGGKLYFVYMPEARRYDNQLNRFVLKGK